MRIFYIFLSSILYPVFTIIIFTRKLIGKEDIIRYKEKIFSSSFKQISRKKERLIWIHAASIGEVLSIIPVIEKLNKENENLNFLITTVTKSSADLLEREYSHLKNLHHRYFPLDNFFLVKKFLKYWSPNLAIFVDSEIWPNFLLQIKKNNIPLILANARITDKTFKRWKIVPAFSKKIFNLFDLCLPSSETSKKNLLNLGVSKISFIGNLKYSTEFKNINLEKKKIEILNKYSVWCAASIHKGEEHFFLETHIKLKSVRSNCLTIIIPRHVSNADYIKKSSEKLKLKAQILNDNDNINDNIDILIINSFGVLGKYFNYCDSVFIGKSLLENLQKVGGQNPIEAAKLGCKIYHGKYVYNFKEIYEFLKLKKISFEINSTDMLKNMLLVDFENKEKINKNLIVNSINIYGEEILIKTINKIKKFI